MAKETTKKQTKTTTPMISACEQYVVEELKKAQKELEQVKRDLFELQKRHIKLVDLVVSGVKALELEDESSLTFKYIKIGGQYGCSIYQDKNRNSQEENDFIALVEYGKSIPTRE